MSRTAILIVAVAAGFVFAAATQAQAQQRYNRPRSSNYLDVFRREAEMYDPLLAPFLPRGGRGVERRTSVPTGTALGGTDTTQVPSLEAARANALARRQAVIGVAPTGTGSTFMNYSHFFQVRRPRR